MAILLCEVCGEQMYSSGDTSQTMLWYHSPLGHNHDDNCISRSYKCENGHSRDVSIIRKCNAQYPHIPVGTTCDWHGKTRCNIAGCGGEKLEEWPEE